VIQLNLARYVKYGSLYEAQVAGRADSPAHRAEHVETAMRLLESGEVTLPGEVNHLQLAKLLEQGVALDLPDGQRMTAGVLRPGSDWVGHTAAERPESEATAQSRIVAVLRGGSSLMAGPRVILQPGDRLLMVVEDGAETTLGDHLGPVKAGAPQVGEAAAVAV
jgi:Trk K+ transport system NAD-binding subunit